MRLELREVRVEDRRVPIGTRPVYELELADNEQIVAIGNQHSSLPGDRVTEDYFLNVWVAREL